MKSLIGTAHALWEQTRDFNPDDYFVSHKKLLKSRGWIVNSMSSPFSDKFLESKDVKSRMWMQTHTLKEGISLDGIDKVMLHVSKPRSRAQGKEIDTLMRVLLATIKLCSVTFGPPPHDTLEIVAMLFDDKKKIKAATSSDRPVLREAHINSGFTQHGEEPLVVLFREEECHKVLVHELFHFWRVHAASQPSLQLPPFVPAGALLMETYVESLATLAVCAYVHGSVDVVKTRIAEEIEHCELNRRRVEQCDHGTTNAWAYFIGKCFAMRSLDTLTDLVDKDPGLHTVSQWSKFVEVLSRGYDIRPAKTSDRPRATGSIRMLACDPVP